MARVLRNQQGYIALVSVLVISALIMAITLSLGFNGFFGRFNILDSYAKERSLALAEACGDVAIGKLITNKDYVLVVADHAIAVGTDTCDIVSLSPGTPRTFPITIRTRGIIGNTYSNVQITINNNYDITEWQEVANF